MSSSREGQLVRQYAAARGWPVLPRNLMVEGDGDVEYFQIAAHLYQEETGRVLLGSELAIFCPGTGDDGGTYGIQRQFPVLTSLTDVDLSEDAKRLFRAVALLDGDAGGKGAYRALTAKHTRLIAYQDVFLLHRVLPVRPGGAEELRQAIESANLSWRTLDCEIEDLIHPAVVTAFFEQYPHYRSSCRIQEIAGERHYSLAPHVKAPLRRFVRDIAVPSDVRRLIDALRAFRAYMGLSPDGAQPPSGADTDPGEPSP
jgi:hypothetical protein